MAVERFDAMTEPLLVDLDEVRAPDANDRYLLLQTLLGAWPMELLGGAPDAGSDRGLPRAHRGIRSQGAARSQASHELGERGRGL